MKIRKYIKIDPLESAIEAALMPGDFIEYNSTWSFISELEAVQVKVEAIADKDPVRAGDLIETFIAGCYEKAEEIDDSSGNLGMFVEELFCCWVDIRQKGDVAHKEKTIAQLIAWIDDDPYGFAHQLERSVCKVLNKKGLNEFAASARLRFDAAKKDDYLHRQWRDSLKTIYAAERDLQAYIALCDETEFLPVDCEVIASLLLSRRKSSEALEWVDKGIEIDKNERVVRGYSYKLDDMRRDILAKLGRSGEALDDAWEKFSDFPSEFSYAELLKYIPTNQHAEWYSRILVVIKTADLDSAITLLFKLKEIDILVGRLRETSNSSLETLGHYTNGQAAEKLSNNYPDVAAKIYRAMGMRIVNAKKSKYYHVAFSNFEQAKRYYEKAGLDTVWQATVAIIREKHHRKYSFMPGFEKIVVGQGPSTQPLFLERAKKRWKK
jgi:hypothetical protein